MKEGERECVKGKGRDGGTETQTLHWCRLSAADFTSSLFNVVACDTVTDDEFRRKSCAQKPFFPYVEKGPFLLTFKTIIIVL